MRDHPEVSSVLIMPFHAVRALTLFVESAITKVGAVHVDLTHPG